MYIKLHLPLFNFAYLFFLSFLSSQHICYFCFHCFIPHLAPCFSFVFQFVLKLVLFLTGKYNFWFPLFTRSIYCTLFLLDSFGFAYRYIFIRVYAYVYMHTCIFHHYLTDFVAAICLGFIFGFLFLNICFQFSSVQFSRSIVSDSLRPHESQHARPPCPSPSPGVHSDSHPSSP